MFEVTVASEISPILIAVSPESLRPFTLGKTV